MGLAPSGASLLAGLHDAVSFAHEGLPGHLGVMPSHGAKLKGQQNAIELGGSGLYLHSVRLVHASETCICTFYCWRAIHYVAMSSNQLYSSAYGPLPAAHLSNPTSGSAIRPPLRLEVTSCDVGAKGLSKLSLLGLHQMGRA